MIDRIVNAVLDSASPAITKWRTVFLLACMVFLSPQFSIFFVTDMLSINLMQLLSMFGDLLAVSVSWVVFGLALSFYIIIPYINYGLLLFFVGRNMSSAEPLLSKLESFRRKDKDDIEKVIEESFDFQEQKAKKSEKVISNYKQRSEIVIMSLAMYVIASLHLDVFSIYIAGAILVLYLTACYWVARKVLLVYLRDIAPYKILEDYVRYFVVVK